MNRLRKPEEIAEVISFLPSDKSLTAFTNQYKGTIRFPYDLQNVERTSYRLQEQINASDYSTTDPTNGAKTLQYQQTIYNLTLQSTMALPLYY